MKAEKLQSVLGLDAENRYGYFIRKVADSTSVWSLENDGWAIAADGTGEKLAPFWPEEAFAAACATDVWSAFKPKSIDLSDFLEKWLPGLKRDGMNAVIFPTPNDKGVIKDPSDVRSDLLLESKQYE